MQSHKSLKNTDFKAEKVHKTTLLKLTAKSGHCNLAKRESTGKP